MIIDGKPLKSCITPLKEGKELRTLVHLPELPPDDREPENFKPLNLKCDVLVIGGGPSGLTSAIELAKLGFEIILIDDKDKLGGKLLLQTHKFFGSIEDCYAGKRGIEIAAGEDLDEYDRRGGPDARIVWCERVDALIAAEALTCETCEGIGIRIRDMQNPKCPACHGTGRKPDKEEANG